MQRFLWAGTFVLAGIACVALGFPAASAVASGTYDIYSGTPFTVDTDGTVPGAPFGFADIVINQDSIQPTASNPGLMARVSANGALSIYDPTQCTFGPCASPSVDVDGDGKSDAKATMAGVDFYILGSTSVCYDAYPTLTSPGSTCGNALAQPGTVTGAPSSSSMHVRWQLQYVNGAGTWSEPSGDDLRINFSNTNGDATNLAYSATVGVRYNPTSPPLKSLTISAAGDSGSAFAISNWNLSATPASATVAVPNSQVFAISSTSGSFTITPASNQEITDIHTSGGTCAVSPPTYPVAAATTVNLTGIGASCGLMVTTLAKRLITLSAIGPPGAGTMSLNKNPTAGSWPIQTSTAPGTSLSARVRSDVASATLGITANQNYQLTSLAASPAGCIGTVSVPMVADSGSQTTSSAITSPISADCTVTGTFERIYRISPTAATNGTLTPGTKQIVVAGGSRSFAVAASQPDYEIDTITMDGSPTTICTGDALNKTCAFTNVQADHTLSATFRLKQRTISLTVTGPAGSGSMRSSPTTTSPNPVSAGGSGSIRSNQAETITFSANSGYELQDLTGTDCVGITLSEMLPAGTILSSPPYAFPAHTTSVGINVPYGASCAVTGTLRPVERPVAFTITGAAMSVSWTSAGAPGVNQPNPFAVAPSSTATVAYVRGSAWMGLTMTPVDTNFRITNVTSSTCGSGFLPAYQNGSNEGTATVDIAALPLTSCSIAVTLERRPSTISINVLGPAGAAATVTWQDASPAVWTPSGTPGLVITAAASGSVTGTGSSFGFSVLPTDTTLYAVDYVKDGVDTTPVTVSAPYEISSIIPNQIRTITVRLKPASRRVTVHATSTSRSPHTQTLGLAGTTWTLLASSPSSSNVVDTLSGATLDFLVRFSPTIDRDYVSHSATSINPSQVRTCTNEPRWSEEADGLHLTLAGNTNQSCTLYVTFDPIAPTLISGSVHQKRGGIELGTVSDNQLGPIAEANGSPNTFHVDLNFSQPMLKSATPTLALAGATITSVKTNWPTPSSFSGDYEIRATKAQVETVCTANADGNYVCTLAVTGAMSSLGTALSAGQGISGITVDVLKPAFTVPTIDVVPSAVCVGVGSVSDCTMSIDLPTNEDLDSVVTTTSPANFASLTGTSCSLEIVGIRAGRTATNHHVTIIMHGDQRAQFDGACTVTVRPVVGSSLSWYDLVGNLFNTSASQITVNFINTTPPTITDVQVINLTKNSTPATYVRNGDTLKVLFTSSRTLDQSPNVRVTDSSGATPYSSTTAATPTGRPNGWAAQFTVSGGTFTPATVQITNISARGILSTAPTATSSFFLDNETPAEKDWLPFDDGTRYVFSASDLSQAVANGTGRVKVFADLRGTCAPSQSQNPPGMDLFSVSMEQVVAVQTPAESFAACGGAGGQPAIGGTKFLRVWFKSVDEAGNASDWLPKIFQAKSFAHVSYHFTPGDPNSIYALEGSTRFVPGTSGNCTSSVSTLCTINVVIESAVYDNGSLPSAIDAYIHEYASGEVRTSLRDPTTSNGWTKLDPVTGLTNTFAFSSASALWPATTSTTTYAVAFVLHARASDTTGSGVVGINSLVLDNLPVGVPALQFINTCAVSSATCTVQEPNGNISPTFVGKIGGTAGTVSTQGAVELFIYRGTNTSDDPIGHMSNVRSTSTGTFNTTYVVGIGSQILTGCTHEELNPPVGVTRDPASCTYTVQARATSLTGVENPTPSAAVTFVIERVKGIGFNATNPVTPIVADGTQHYDLALTVRDQFGNRIPDASLGCFTKAGSWDASHDNCVSNARQVLLPEEALPGDASPANIDLVSDNDGFDASAVVVSPQLHGSSRALLAGLGDRAGSFTGTVVGLAPSIDTRRYVPRASDGLAVANPGFGQSTGIDLDLKTALYVPCSGCTISGSVPGDQFATDHRYLLNRTTDARANADAFASLSVYPASNVDTTDHYLGRYADMLVFSPMRATREAQWADPSFRSALQPQVPTVQVNPMIEASIAQIDTEGGALSTLASVAYAGGFDTLWQSSGRTMPTGYTLNPNASMVSTPIAGGSNAVKITGDPGLITGGIGLKVGSSYTVRISALADTTDSMRAPVAVTATLLNPGGSVALSQVLTPETISTHSGHRWQDYSAVLGPITAAMVSPTTAIGQIQLSVVPDVNGAAVVDTLIVSPIATGEVAPVTPLILGSATRWQVDLTNRGGTDVTVDPMTSLASLSFRYGTAIWGKFSDMTLQYCDPMRAEVNNPSGCGTALPLTSEEISTGTQNLSVALCDGNGQSASNAGGYGCTDATPMAYRLVSPGNFLRLTFTATAGMATARVASTQGLAETAVRFPFSLTSQQFSSYALGFANANIAGPSYFSNALALDIFNPIGRLANTPSPDPMRHFTREELASIRADIRKETTLETRVKELPVGATCLVNGVLNRDAQCITAAGRERQTFVATGNLSANWTDARPQPGLQTKIFEDTLDPAITLRAVSPVLPAAAVTARSELLPTYREGHVALVPGNLVIQSSDATTNTVCVPEGAHTLVVRGNLILLANLRATSPGDALCPAASGHKGTEAFGLITLSAITSNDGDASALGDPSTLPGGNLFIHPMVGRIESSIYAEGAILALDSSQSVVNLATVSSPEAALANTGGIRIVANDSTRPEVLRNQLLFAGRNVIGMLNTWGGAVVDEPHDRTVDARVALDLSIHRLYQLDDRGGPLRGGTPTPGIENFPSYRLNSVLVVQPLGQSEGLAVQEPPIFARTGAFQAQEVALH